MRITLDPRVAYAITRACDDWQARHSAMPGMVTISPQTYGYDAKVMGDTVDGKMAAMHFGLFDDPASGDIEIRLHTHEVR